MLFEKTKRWRSEKWRNAARMQCCTMRLEGVCNMDRETTVFAHANGAGMAMKADDFDGCDCCSACHDVLDGRVKARFSQEEIADRFKQARYETIRNRILRGVVK